MSNARTRRAAHSQGGILMEPPITREAATDYFNCEIPTEAWTKIVMALSLYADVLDHLDASRPSKSKKPEISSWHQRKSDTVKALEGALDRLQAAQSKGDFLHEASENYSLATFGSSAGPELSADRMLREAHKKIVDALVIIERAEPMDIDLPTEANARAILVRSIYNALSQSGIQLNAANGYSLGMLDRAARLSDLSPFEQFLDVLGIGEEMTVKSFSVFVRSAIAAGKGG